MCRRPPYCLGVVYQSVYQFGSPLFWGAISSHHEQERAGEFSGRATNRPEQGRENDAIYGCPLAIVTILSVEILSRGEQQVCR